TCFHSVPAMCITMANRNHVILTIGVRGCAAHENGLTSHENGLTGHENGLTSHENGLTGHENGLTGHENGLTGHENGLTGHEIGLSAGLESRIRHSVIASRYDLKVQ